MEKELQLSVQNLELGTLTTNAMAIRDKVKTLLEDYKEENYNEDTVDKAKEDKALLNKTSKMLNDERIRLEKEFMTPFNEFKEVVTETTTMIKAASSKIDDIVKGVEERAKEQRNLTIEEIFKEKIQELGELITLDQIFDDRWLNKGSFNDKGEFKLTKELEEKLNNIRVGLETIKSLKSKHELALTNQYLKTFNLSEIIVENNRLNELEQKTVIVEEKKEEIKEAKIEEMTTIPFEVGENDPIKTYTLTITGELSKQKQLKEFLKLNKMHTVNTETGEVVID